LWSSLGQTGDAFDLSLIPREPYVWRGM
jgi:hypothetical protein